MRPIIRAILFALILSISGAGLVGCAAFKDAGGSTLEQIGFDAGVALLAVAPNSSDAFGKAKWGWYIYGVLEQVAGNPDASAPMLSNLLNKAIPNDGPAWTRLVSQAIQAGVSQFKGTVADNIRHFAKGFGEAIGTLIPPSTEL